MSIFQDTTLTQGQRLVWFAVQECTTGRACYLSVSELAEHMNSDRSYVSKALKTLRRRGWIDEDGAGLAAVTPEATTPEATAPEKNGSFTAESAADSRAESEAEDAPTPAESGPGGGENGACLSDTESAHSADEGRKRVSQTRACLLDTEAASSADEGRKRVSQTHPENPSSPSFSLPPMNNTSNPLPTITPNTLEKSVVEEKSSTAPPSPLSEISVGWLPPGHPSLQEELPADHPAVSERHLRYHLAADWSIQLMQQAEAKIKSYRIPSGVRRKLDRSRAELIRDYADTYRLLEEQDGYDWSEIRAGIHWLFTRSSWLREGYIASVNALRKGTRSDDDRTKFDVILTQARADDGYSGPEQHAEVGSGRSADRGRDDETLEERYQRNREIALRAVGAR